MTERDVPWGQFYEAVGRGITAWALVENALCDLFSRLVICAVGGSVLSAGFDRLWVIGNIFNSFTNLDARLRMMDATIRRLVSDPDLVAEWNAVKNRTKEQYRRRIVLAHGGVYGNADRASVLGGPIFSSNRERLTYQQVSACSESFKALEGRITELAIAVNKHLVARVREIHPLAASDAHSS